jgi:predicted N-acetyltransferase YhbS
MITIRQESVDDFAAVGRVVERAFAASEHGHQGEAGLVAQLRQKCVDALSLVAVNETNRVVGHLLFTPVVLLPSNLRGMGLAPLAVDPQVQNRGVGSQLVQHGLAQLQQLGVPGVVVIGHPRYYQRFGFQPAEAFGVKHGFAGIPQEVLMMRVFDESVADQLRGNTVMYHSEFGPQCT